MCNTFYTWEVPGSNIGFSQTEAFRGSPQFLQENARIVSRLVQDCFLPNCFLFIIHLSSYHSILYPSLSTDSSYHTTHSDRRSTPEKRCIFNVVEPSKRRVILRRGKALKVSKSCKRNEDNVKCRVYVAPTIIGISFYSKTSLHKCVMLETNLTMRWALL
jgi:hypothetical protein